MSAHEYYYDYLKDYLVDLKIQVMQIEKDKANAIQRS